MLTSAVTGLLSQREPRSLGGYSIGESQVATPPDIVALFWRLVGTHRKQLGRILDMGAGDCRFAKNGIYNSYVGVEIDEACVDATQSPVNGELIHDCVFLHVDGEYDGCIGNPPYVRHHSIESPWKERTAARLGRLLDTKLDLHCNLYLYFLGLALAKTHSTGLVALLIPYEWVSRPSARALRQCIKRERWNVSVYRFCMPVFDGVLTTASISIIDKAHREGHWEYYDIQPDLTVRRRTGMVDATNGVLEYARRGAAWTLRGLSPGSQNIFCLTEDERQRNGLNAEDVAPCVTSLRCVPGSLRQLTRAAFHRHYVRAGQRCWLVRSYESKHSTALSNYLESVPEEDRQTRTCQNQTPWYRFVPHAPPQLLVSSGFTEFGPKVLVNSVSAHAVGATYGIHSSRRLPLRRLQDYLLETDFAGQVVAHAKTLKKIEPRQLNAVLNQFTEHEERESE